MVAQQLYLTREGYQELERELNYLSTARREEVARLLREALEARADLLADGLLESARSDQAFVEGRIQELKTILSKAKIIDEATLPRDRVALGSYVTIVDVRGDGTPERYRIVSPVEADPLNGKISHESPLGSALMGRKVGDQVVVKAPDGDEVFRVLAICPSGGQDGKPVQETPDSGARARRFSNSADRRRLSGRAAAGAVAG